MKKMIPVYLLQIAMLATVLFVNKQILNEMRSMKAEIKAEPSSTKQPENELRRIGDPAMRVIIVR